MPHSQNESILLMYTASKRIVNPCDDQVLSDKNYLAVNPSFVFLADT